MVQQKRNLFLLISTIITLIVSTYVLYETVFEQIISQSQGYFYAGVFGFILLLVFLLCNLFTKLIATSTTIQNSLAWRITAIVILGFICLIFIVTRMRYTSSLSGVESYVYRAALSISDGSLYQNKELVKDCLANSGNFSYAILISLIFQIFGESSNAFILTNVIIYALCTVLIYRITMLISDRLCGLVAALISIIIPAQTFNVYTYDSNPLFSLIVLLFIDVIIHLFSVFDGSDKVKIIIYTVFAGVLTGFLLHIEFVMIIFAVFLVLAAFITKREHSLNILIGIAAGLFVFALLSFVKSVITEEDYGTVIAESVASFDPTFDISEGATLTGDEIYSRFVEAIAIQDDNIESTYFFLYNSDGQAAFTELFKSWVLVENQLIYMFLLIMLISCSIIALKENFIEIIPFNLFFICSVLQLFFSQCRDLNRHYFISMLVVLTGISLHYLYLNHHPEQKTLISTLDAIEQTGRENTVKPVKQTVATKELTEEDFVKRARALVFIGNDEDLYKRIKNEEHKKAMASGNKRAIENSFDDYDEDFFLDTGDEDIDHAKTETVTALNVNLPVWKQKPEKFGEDNRFFDDEDEEDVYEDSADVYDEGEIEDNNDVISVSALTKDANTSSTNSPEPKVEKIKRSKKEAKKSQSKTNSSDLNALNTGKAVRKVKAVGQKTVVTSHAEPKPGEALHNPLPTPKKKEHKKIDYAVKETPKRNNSSNDGWDYAYDIDDNDDWDV